MDRQTNRIQLPGVLVRDALRGLRFGARQVGHVFTSAGIPEPLGTAASGFIRKADKLSSEVELMSRNSIGGSFKPNVLPDSSVFDETGLMTARLSLSECTNTAKAGLIFALNALGETNPFISEYLCQTCMARFLKADKEKIPAQKCSALFDLLVDQKVCGMPPGFNLVAGDKEQERVVAAYFATSLWLFVPRAEAASEEELLAHCCQVADSKRAEIFAQQSESPTIRQLFEYYLNII